MNYLIIIIAIISACLTYYINFNLKGGGVLASAVVSLSAGILLPYLFIDKGDVLATVAASASYSAMVTKKRFPKLTDMIFVGLLCGIIFLLTRDVFLNIGGKLGSIGAVAGLTWLSMKNIWGKLINKV